MIRDVIFLYDLGEYRVENFKISDLLSYSASKFSRIFEIYSYFFENLDLKFLEN